MVAAAAVVRVAAAVHLQRLRPEFDRDALAASRLRAVPRLSRVPVRQALAAQPHSAAGLAARRRRGVLRRVPVPVLPRDLDPAGRADDARHRLGGRRHAAAARGDAPRRRTAARDHRHPDAGIRVRGSAHAGRDRAQGHLAQQGGVPLLAHHRGCVRRRAGSVGELHLPVRAVRVAAREGRRRQLFHQGRVRPARAHARRTGQGRRRVVGPDGHDLRLVGRQRRHLRNVHDPADEARRLLGGKGRRDRGRRRRRRPDHAAGHGRRGVPDGGVRRRPLFGDRQERVPAGDHLVHRALLHRPSRGLQGGHLRHPDPRELFAVASAGRRPDDDRGRRHRRERRLLRAGMAQAAARQRGDVGRARAARRRLRADRAQGGGRARPDRRRSQCAGAHAAAAQGNAARGPAFPAARGRARLGAAGGRAVAGAVGVLRDRAADRDPAYAAAADRVLPPAAGVVRRVPRGLRRPGRAVSSAARAT